MPAQDFNVLGALVHAEIERGARAYGPPWYEAIWRGYQATPKLKHVKEKERRMAESEEKKRFRSFAERYVVARAHLFPVDDELNAAWACLLNAKTAYKMINGAGAEFEPLPDAADTQAFGPSSGQAVHRPIGATGAPGNPWLSSQSLAQQASRLYRAGALGGNQAQSQSAIAAKVAAIKAAGGELSPFKQLFERLKKKDKAHHG